MLKTVISSIIIIIIIIIIVVIVVCYMCCSVEYRREILYPIVQCIARRVGTTDLYQGMVFDQEPLVMPRGTCELETRIRQASAATWGMSQQLTHKSV